MPILNVNTNQVGLVGVTPNIVQIATNDTESAILTTGYLNHIVQSGTSFPMPCLAEVSSIASPGAQPQVGWYQVSHVGSNWSLVPPGNAGDVVLPTIANHLAVFTNTTGTLGEDAATAINGGNIQAGLSGTAGYVSSFPSTAATGSLRLLAVANSGNTLVTISNALHGQASVYSIPDSGAASANFIISAQSGTQHITGGAFQVDAGAISSGLATGGFVGLVRAFPTTTASGFIAIQGAVNGSGNFGTTISNATTQAQSQVVTIPDVGAATGQFLAKTAALVSGNLIKASGTAGLVVDAGFAVKANTTAAYAGGGTSNAFTATGLTTSSIVTAVILTSTNAVAIAKAVPTANTLTVTFSADPGAATTVSWIAITPAV